MRDKYEILVRKRQGVTPFVDGKTILNYALV